jgi:hypothetical protein
MVVGFGISGHGSWDNGAMGFKILPGHPGEQTMLSTQLCMQYRDKSFW